LLNFQDHILAASNPAPPPNAVPDTIMYKIILTDKAGNKSDTVKTEPIFVDRQ
jgi:hypothetical protein